MKIKLFFLLCLLAILPISSQVRIPLAGEWQFAIDPQDKGLLEKWYAKKLTDKVNLPGSMAQNGKGFEVTVNTKFIGDIIDSSYFKSPRYAKYREPGNIKLPFWLQSVKYYAGAAWYQKEVTVPSDWKGQQLGLFLERCHWESRVWVDQSEAGMQNSLGTPHQYDLTRLLTPGKHRITICIDNRIKDFDPGVNSHSISDHTQSNWNGIVGQMYLEAKPLVQMTSIQVFPDVPNKQIAVRVTMNNPKGKTLPVTLSLSVSNLKRTLSSSFKLLEGEQTKEFLLPMGDDFKLWSEFHPEVYTLEANLKVAKTSDTRSTTFGMRTFNVVGKQISINGKPVFLRGTLECAIFPKTGYPATDEASWLRIFKICKAHGLNHVRFHSWCPPEAAFDAADQSGIYLQVECSSWANQSTTVGDGKGFDTYLYEESKRMVQAYGNHPSFCMMAYGNEPAGANMKPFLTSFVQYWKERDVRRIYTVAAGWPNLPVSDYLSDSEPRIQKWGQGVKSIINAEEPSTAYDWSAYIKDFKQPMVSHEIGQWCVYPNFKEIAKYEGVLKAKNFEIFQETLQEQGMAQLADSFLLASGKLQALCYKADIEAALRTNGFGGFQLLDLHDFPGQGTALVGVLDPFWDEKGYISPAEYKRFCNSTVPLARMKKLVYTNDESFEVSAEVAHYGDLPILGCQPRWTISTVNGTVLQLGVFAQRDIPIGNGISLGEVSYSLKDRKTPEKLIFELTVGSFSNSWEFWVYPSKKALIPGVESIKMVERIDDETLKFLNNGGVVLLSLKKGSLASAMGGNIQIGFSSIFWNTAWTSGQAPHTLGILVNQQHPALAEFPTEYHSNYQWRDAMSHSGAMDLSAFPQAMKPIVRVIDDWFTNRPLALVLEAKVGKGKVLVSSIDFGQDLERRPEAQQLLYSLKKYMASSQFQPSVGLTDDQLKRLTH